MERDDRFKKMMNAIVADTKKRHCMKVGVGDKIYIPDQKRPFKVQARDDRYIIATKPYNPKRTVIYFIIDLEKRLRGPDNMVFGFGYETREQCEDRLKDLQDGVSEVSLRKSVPLDLDVI